MIGAIRGLVIALLAACCTAALAQNQPGKILPVEGKVLDIVGVSLGIESALKDLGAKVVGQEIVIELSADVLFDFDKADLKPAAVDSLAKVAAVLKGMPGSPATIDGHTDGKGSDAYNLRLSKARARSVRDWLVSHQVLPCGTEIVGFGKSMPVAPNVFDDGSDNPEGRQKNRRVEITVETCKG